MKIRAFITHKKAESFRDCQDRFSINRDTKSVAVSDGMSQSIFQKIWAELLVNEYTGNTAWHPHTFSDNQDAVKELCRKWRSQVNDLIGAMPENNVRYRSERSLAEGRSAGATLVGVRFAGNKWNGDVLGDSCLLVVENNEIICFITSQDGDTFDNHPDYYDSHFEKKGRGKAIAIEGELRNGQTILLVSDPFSDFLKEHQLQHDEAAYIRELLQVDSHDAFEDLVRKWRDEYGMHNDDSTLIVIEPDGSEDFNIQARDDINQLIDRDTKNTRLRR